MRLCVPIPCFFPKMDFADALRRVKALGFDAAEGYDLAARHGIDLF